MKFKHILITTIATLAVFSSCTDGFEAENTDPNRPILVPIYGIFNNSTKQVVNYSRGSFGSARAALPWVNYSAQMEYTEEDRYQLRTGTEGNIFDQYYYQANNFKNIIGFCDDGSALQYGNVDNQRAASRIMLAYIFHNLTDIFGDVPYYSYGNPDPDFQALDVANVAPKFASQEKIYADLLNELKQAANDIDLANPIIFKGGGELTFGNSAVKLKKFANSLRLRVANRIKGYAPLSAVANQHIAELIADPSQLMSSNSESVGVTFEQSTINPAPQYTAFFLGDRRNDYTVSNQFLDLLKGKVSNSGIDSANPDPRIYEIVMKAGTPITAAQAATYPRSTNLDEYTGMPFGVPTNQTATQRAVPGGLSFMSFNILKTNYTEYYMEYAEVEFLLSENKGWDDAHYKAGVTASLAKWGVAAATASSYVNALPPANQTNVMTQKYVALFMQPYETWAEYRRTGYPQFIVKPGDQINLVTPINGQNTITFETMPLQGQVLTDLPRRFQYPYQQETLNNAQYKAASENIGGDYLYTKLIFDKNY